MLWSLRRILLGCILLLSIPVLRAQEYSYLHYDIKDGLAGSVVHGMAQDRDGFMWFTTETGLSRFDGKHFRNFTRADGLPSNEVFGIFVDSRNRLWITSFKNAVCYYYKGKIHNQENDPVLRRIKLSSEVDGYAETTGGDIIITYSGNCFVIPGDDPQHIRHFTAAQQQEPSLPRILLRSGMSNLPAMAMPPYLRKQLRPDGKRSLVTMNYGSPQTRYLIRSRDSFIIAESDSSRASYNILPQKNILVTHFINDTVLFLTSIHDGAFLYDFKNREKIASYRPCPRVHSVFRDNEGNLWFSTKGQGVFFLANPSFITYTFEKDGQPSAVYSISKQEKGRFSVNTSDGEQWLLKGRDDTGRIFPLQSQRIDHPSDKGILAQAGAGLTHVDTKLAPLFPGRNLSYLFVKTLFAFNDTLLLAASSGAYIYHLPQLRILDTIYASRSTCALKIKDTYFIGTLNGLIRIKNSVVEDLGSRSPILKSRISTLACDTGGTLWIATYDGGVIGYRDGQVIHLISDTATGISSNICISLFVQGSYLWIGTDKGLNKVDISGRPRLVARYDVTDGLRSNIVNALYAEGSHVFAGTLSGLTCFDERSAPRHAACPLWIYAATVSGKTRAIAPGSLLRLPHKDNNIRFDFACLSFRSGGYVQFRYRLLGLDSAWQTTRETFLQYPSLPSGRYTLQLMAVNKFGDESALGERHFEIGQTVWERLEMQLGAGVLLLALVILLMQLRFRRLQQKEREEQLIHRKMKDLEQTALRAQMNPHFIFNCLNSVQNFILEQDVQGANFYLNRFAVMVRQTLQNVSRQNITLSEEISYLSGYLDLERMQMTETFRYQVETEAGMPLETIGLPVMILQPFVENAVKHGVSKLGATGVINISFTVIENVLKCIISDNGPGILTKQQQGAAKKHTSMGMAVTYERIALLNQLSPQDKQIGIAIGWAYVTEEKCYGTQITLDFPQ